MGKCKVTGKLCLHWERLIEDCKDVSEAISKASDMVRWTPEQIQEQVPIIRYENSVVQIEDVDGSLWQGEGEDRILKVMN